MRKGCEKLLQRQSCFFVYRIFIDPAVTLYVGKGSGRRLEQQMAKFAAQGEIIEYYDNEKQAYKAEKKYIKLLQPEMNRNAGGGGSALKKRKPRGYKEWLPTPLNIALSKQYAAQVMLKLAIAWDSAFKARLHYLADGGEVKELNA